MSHFALGWEKHKRGLAGAKEHAVLDDVFGVALLYRQAPYPLTSHQGTLRDIRQCFRQRQLFYAGAVKEGIIAQPFHFPGNIDAFQFATTGEGPIAYFGDVIRQLD